MAQLMHVITVVTVITMTLLDRYKERKENEKDNNLNNTHNTSGTENAETQSMETANNSVRSITLSCHKKGDKKMKRMRGIKKIIPQAVMELLTTEITTVSGLLQIWDTHDGDEFYGVCISNSGLKFFRIFSIGTKWHWHQDKSIEIDELKNIANKLDLENELDLEDEND